MQQFVHRYEGRTTAADVHMPRAPRRTYGRVERALISTLLWVLSALIFVVVAVSLAAILQHVGMPSKYVELVLGLTYFPLYLLVRKVWITGRNRCLATELDAFFETHNTRV